MSRIFVNGGEALALRHRQRRGAVADVAFRTTETQAILSQRGIVISIGSSKTKRRIAQLGYLLRHPWQQWQHWRFIAAAKHVGVASAGQASWRNLGLYLRDDLSPADRAAMIQSHYGWLLHHAPANLQGRHWSEGFILWQRLVGPTTYTMWVGPSSFSSMEGELQISLVSDDFRLFTLTCLILPARVLGIDRGQILFIGGMQGRYAGRDRTRAAARDLGEIAPAALVVIAARVLASALGLDGVAAINSEQQASRSYSGERQHFDYDEHWMAVGADRLPSGLFLLHGIEVQRDLTHLSSSHRSRARRKAKVKAEMAAEMATRLSTFGTVSQMRDEDHATRNPDAGGFAFPEMPVAMTIRGPVPQQARTRRSGRWLAR